MGAGADKNEEGGEGVGRDPLPTKKFQSEGGPALTKMKGGGEGPPKKNVSLRGDGVDLPECEERRRGKHDMVRVSCFFCQKKKTDRDGRKIEFLMTKVQRTDKKTRRRTKTRKNFFQK